MKKLILTSIVTLIINITGVNAQNEIVSLSQNKMETTKECIFLNSQKYPVQKSTYTFDSNGLRTSTIIYKWEDKTGWKECMRYTYNYSDSTLLSIDYSEWSSKKQIWQNQQIQYSETDIFLAQNTNSKSSN